MRIHICIATALLLVCGAANAAEVYDVLEVNGHPGYITAREVSPDGVIDKVMMLCEGFDTDNDDHPIDDINDDWQPLIDQLGPDGWDIIIFDYVRGDIDIKQNAENLAHFMGVLDSWAVPNYHMCLIGGSMGGIVTRCMFAQEYSDMGVDTYITVDSPHYGVYLSPWVEGLATWLIDAVAGHQMAHGEPEYNELYGWMQSIENDGTFKPTIIDPMDTLAIALSNGESAWEVSWSDLLIHTDYHPVCSYVYEEGLWSDYMPYHSVILADDTSYESSGFLDKTFWYNSTATSYFDAKQPNPQTEHSAPAFAVQQAVDFAVAHAPSGPPVDTTPPVITVLGDNPATVEVGQTYVDAGATATDDVDGDITASIVTVNNVDTGVIGTYQVTYDVTDAAGNAAVQAVRTVSVVAAADTTPPVLTLIGDAVMTIQRRTTYVELGATVYDEGDPNVEVVIGGDVVDTKRTGTYVVTYDATDASGNQAVQLTRTVNVVK